MVEGCPKIEYKALLKLYFIVRKYGDTFELGGHQKLIQKFENMLNGLFFHHQKCANFGD